MVNFSIHKPAPFNQYTITVADAETHNRLRQMVQYAFANSVGGGSIEDTASSLKEILPPSVGDFDDTVED